VLGVSAGAGFGASLAIILFGSDTFYVYVFAFCFGILAVVLSYVIGTNYTSTPTIMLVLGGVVVSSIFSSLVSLLKYIADPYEQLPSIVFWLMGSMASARFRDIAISAIPMGVGMAGLVAMRWRLNILSMDDREAQALGVNVIFVKGLAILFATLGYRRCGMRERGNRLGGLVVPHMGRMLVGNDNTVLVPTCLSIGAGYLIMVDNVARTLTGLGDTIRNTDFDNRGTVFCISPQKNQGTGMVRHVNNRGRKCVLFLREA
jgi:iron complex transport system permease protein